MSICCRIAKIGLPLLVVVIGLTVNQAFAFDFHAVVAKARRLAQHAYRPLPKIPSWLRVGQLSYAQYENMRFNPRKRLWLGDHSNFQVLPMPAGLYYQRPIKIHVVKNGRVTLVRFKKSDFSFPGKRFRKRVPPDLGFGGFALTYPFHPGAPYNIFLVFAGASYFRGVGKNNNFGLSARGLAINTGLAKPESFPRFRSFWLLKPPKHARHMVVYALLDGKYVTGAYRFLIQPGVKTRVGVTAILFFRHQPQRLGLAPLTSMFFYGRNTPRPREQWRPAVHDSDGLLIANGDGEWIWRPLLNPVHVTTSSFQVAHLKGFGLVQRARRFSTYEDLGANYQSRPNGWIVPGAHWPKGRVMLVELPESSETEDNVAAFYTPDRLPETGKPYRFRYQIVFGGASVGHPPAGFVAGTFVGSGVNPGAKAGNTDRCTLRFALNFKGGELARLTSPQHVQGVVSAENGAAISDVVTRRAPQFDGWRLAFRVKPVQSKPLELRAYLKGRHGALTETWSYLLPVANWHKIESGCGSAS